jgi:hypothetical protein
MPGRSAQCSLMGVFRAIADHIGFSSTWIMVSNISAIALLLTWLSNEHVKQWWNDGDDTLEKVALHYGAEKPDVARFIIFRLLDPHTEIAAEIVVSGDRPILQINHTIAIFQCLMAEGVI